MNETKDAELLLFRDKNILVEEALAELQDLCNQKHGKQNIPGYSLCAQCVNKLLFNLLDSFLCMEETDEAKLIDKKSVLREMKRIFYPPLLWPSSGNKAHALSLAIKDALSHENAGFEIGPGWILDRAKHYMRAEKTEQPSRYSEFFPSDY